jgi:hypothetical protein
MAAPSGVRVARWNNTVSAIATQTGRTEAVVDTWLNRVWSARYDDEEQEDIPFHDRLVAALLGRTTAVTLPQALERWFL